MMKVWISPYKLKLADSGETREGFLLKLQTSEFEAGYSDCFPWQSFGDPSVSQLVEWIQPGKSSPLLQRSLYFAKLDGIARAEKKKLLSTQIIKNHYLVTNLMSLNSKKVEDLLGKGFISFKIKVGENPEEETKQFRSCFEEYFDKVSFRLDFNCRFTSKYSELISLCKNLEFVEDPTETAEEWEGFRKDFRFPVALDQALKNKYFDLQVIKPAKQGEQDYLTKDIVFTSYMDHPVGQAFALYQAQQFGPQKRDYGLMSHHIYDSHLFSNHLANEKNTFSVLGDYGIGFDDLWSQVEWQKII